MTLTLRFIGTDRRGHGRAGSLRSGDVAVFVESRYSQGWRSLEVYDGTRVIGAIVQPQGKRRRRLWWSERSS